MRISHCKTLYFSVFREVMGLWDVQALIRGINEKISKITRKQQLIHAIIENHKIRKNRYNKDGQRIKK